MSKLCQTDRGKFAVAVPTIVALEQLLECAEELERQCGRGHMRREEMRDLLSELDRRTEVVLRAGRSTFSRPILHHRDQDADS